MNSKETNYDRILTWVLCFILIITMGVVGTIGIVMVSKLSTTPGDVFEEVVNLRKQIQINELEKTESQMFMDVMETQGSAMVLLDSNGKILLWSKGAEEYFGHKKEQATGYGIAFLIPNGMREEHRAAFEKAMNSTKDMYQRIIECDALHADGSLIPSRIILWVTPGRKSIAVFTHREQ